MAGEPRTGRGRASRERIVERAAELVAERGVAGTSLDEVLAAAGASKSQLYHYFAGRDELVEAAVARRCAQVLGELTHALGNVAALAAELEATLAAFVAGFEQQGLPGCPIGSLASEVAERNDGRGCRRQRPSTPGRGLLADALERMRERGELRADAPPGALATALLASIEGGLLLSQTRKRRRRCGLRWGGARARADLPGLRLDSSSTCCYRRLDHLVQFRGRHDQPGCSFLATTATHRSPSL